MDLAPLHEELVFQPDNTAEPQCVDVVTYNDTIYEGTESRAIFLRNGDVTLNLEGTILEIVDQNS